MPFLLRQEREREREREREEEEGGRGGEGRGGEGKKEKKELESQLIQSRDPPKKKGIDRAYSSKESLDCTGLFGQILTSFVKQSVF